MTAESERTPIRGIHHVTAVAADPDENVQFYTDVLGLRMVKKTVNFDDVSTFHFYYGNERGTPGTAMTFFPVEDASAGLVGPGQVSTTAFQAPAGSIDYWSDRLEDHGVDYAATTRFGEDILAVSDPAGLQLELVFTDAETHVESWEDGPVPAEYALCGFHSVALSVRRPPTTATLLEAMGFERTASVGGRIRYESTAGRKAGAGARIIDLVETAGKAVPGAGTVHHVAFRVPDDATQAAWREALTERGFHVTRQKDRTYFRSIYFREENGILFELATDGPGFTVDEPVAQLGRSLRLPEWLEGDRASIESSLPSLELEPVRAAGGSR